jgi:hypothetical protein
MQNTLENGKILYSEYSDGSGFMIREMHETKNPRMRFQAGRLVMAPFKEPIYRQRTVTHHVDRDDIQKFHLLGWGFNRSEALDMASNRLLRAEIAKH